MQNQGHFPMPVDRPLHLLAIRHANLLREGRLLVGRLVSAATQAVGHRRAGHQASCRRCRRGLLE